MFRKLEEIGGHIESAPLNKNFELLKQYIGLANLNLFFPEQGGMVDNLQQLMEIQSPEQGQAAYVISNGSFYRFSQNSWKKIADLGQTFQYTFLNSGLVSMNGSMTVNENNISIPSMLIFIKGQSGDGNFVRGVYKTSQKNKAIPVEIAPDCYLVTINKEGEVLFEEKNSYNRDKNKVVLGQFTKMGSGEIDFLYTKPDMATTADRGQFKINELDIKDGQAIPATSLGVNIRRAGFYGEGINYLVGDPMEYPAFSQDTGNYNYIEINENNNPNIRYIKPIKINEQQLETFSNTIITNYYWNGSELVVVPEGSFTIQRHLLDIKGDNFIAYGDKVYTSRAQAMEDIAAMEDLQLDELMSETTRILIKSGAADTNNTEDFVFFTQKALTKVGAPEPVFKDTDFKLYQYDENLNQISKVGFSLDDITLGTERLIQIQDKNYTLADHQDFLNLDLQKVPYTGATSDLLMGDKDVRAKDIYLSGGLLFGDKEVIRSIGDSIALGDINTTSVDSQAKLAISNTQDSSSSVTGSVTTLGGLGVSKSAYFGSDVDITNDLKIGNSLSIGGEDIEVKLQAVKNYSDQGDLNLQQQVDALKGSFIYIGRIHETTINVHEELLTQRAITLTGAEDIQIGWVLIDDNNNEWYYSESGWINLEQSNIFPAENDSLGIVIGGDDVNINQGHMTVLRSDNADALGGFSPEQYVKTEELDNYVQSQHLVTNTFNVPFNKNIVWRLVESPYFEKPQGMQTPVGKVPVFMPYEGSADNGTQIIYDSQGHVFIRTMEAGVWGQWENKVIEKVSSTDGSIKDIITMNSEDFGNLLEKDENTVYLVPDAQIPGIVPEGGSAGQALIKRSLNDYDIEWGVPSSLSWGEIGGNIFTQVDLMNQFDLKADHSNVILKDNLEPYSPMSDYHPATKKYVDDNKGDEAQWGNITGLLTEQTDLFNELTLKVNVSDVLKKDNQLSFTPTEDFHPATKKYVDEEGGPDVSEILDLVYPVGSVYLAVNDSNPAVLFGGTWINIGNGKTLVGVDPSDTAFDGPEKTGGHKDTQEHTHTQSAHTHTQNSHTHTQNSHTHSQGSHTHSGSSNSTGAHNHTGRYAGFIGSSFGLNTSGWYLGRRVVSNDTYHDTHTMTHTAGGAHSHTISVGSTTASNNSTTASNNSTTASNNNTTATNNTYGTGNSGNLQPYLTVYMWKRTA